MAKKYIDAELIPYTDLSDGRGLCLVAFKEEIDRQPAADVIEKIGYDLLLKRFRHLIQSDFISSFDARDFRTGKYKRDIKEADNVREVRCGKWMHNYQVCSICGAIFPADLNSARKFFNYCPNCGAIMDQKEGE